MSLLNMDWIGHHARRDPHKLALVDLGSGRKFSYEAMDRRIASLASGLSRALGVGPGDRLAVLAHNTSDTFELQFACIRLGAILVPLHVRASEEQLADCLARLRAAALFHDHEHAATARAFEARGLVRARLLYGPGGEYEALLSAHDGAVRPGGDPMADADAVSMILFTSGTTGRPKGTLLTNRMTFFNAVNMSGPARIDQNAVHLCVLPLFHSAGFNLYANPVFHAGGTVLVAPRFDAGAFLRIVSDPSARLTHVFGVPTAYVMIAEHPAFSRTDLSALKVAGVGGAPTPEALIRAYAGRGVALQQGYGMTEGGPALFVIDLADAVRKAGSIGKPLMHVAARIVDEDGAEPPAGGLGEIEVRGPTTTPGYWEEPEASAELYRDGWMRTGDIGRVDEEGFWHITGRRKDMFISGGENVHPAEIEQAVASHPGVLEVAVIGVGHALWGEVGHAFVVPRPGVRLSADELIELCERRLARFKRPHRFVLVDELPRNELGKVDRARLRRLSHAGADVPEEGSA